MNDLSYNHTNIHIKIDIIIIITIIAEQQSFISTVYLGYNGHKYSGQSAGWGNDLKKNTYQYHVSYFDLASHMRQDQNTIHDNLIQYLHRLTSKTNNSRL